MNVDRATRRNRQPRVTVHLSVSLGDLVSLEVHLYAPAHYYGTSVRCGTASHAKVATSHAKVATGVIEVFKCRRVVVAAVVKIIHPGTHRRLTLCELSAIGTGKIYYWDG